MSWSGKPPEQVTFELRPEGDDGGAMWIYRGRVFVRGRGNSRCKGPVVGEGVLACWRKR